MDYMPRELARRLRIMTFALPIVFAFTCWQYAKAKPMRWLWPPAVLYALWLGLGPHAGKIGDDLLPAVRALGAMQTVVALGIGAGIVMIGEYLWTAPWDRWFKSKPVKGGKPGDVSSIVYGMRTLI